MTRLPALTVKTQLQHLQLDIGSAIGPGWVLVSGQLEYDEPELEAVLVTESKQGETLSFNLPVALKGKLYELVRLPKQVTDTWLEVKSIGSVTGADSVRIESINPFTSRYLMWRRLYNTYTLASKSQRRLLGLTTGGMLFKPYPSYALVGKSRYYTASPSYPEWVAQSEQFTSADSLRLKRTVKRLGLKSMMVEVVIDARSLDSAEPVLESLTSLHAQLEIPFRPWVLTSANALPQWAEILQDQAELISDDSLAAHAGLPCSYQPQWVFMMQAGTRLAPWALAWMATETRNSNTAFIYSDHDYLVDGKRVNPQFKPDWSEELARTSGYVGSAFALRADLFSQVVQETGFDCAYQLVLDAAALTGPEAISHIPAVLCHYGPQCAVTASQQALEQHLRRRNIAARVEPQGAHQRVRYQLPANLPKVSIVVPTRDALSYLKTCVESLLQKTTWPDYELLIVDNQSSEPAALAYLRQLDQDARVKVLRYDQPFNFSAINNFAVKQANGEVICLLNNDTEVISPDWLEEMVSRLLQSGVGVVGTRLYFSDGRVQHAGDVLGPGGCATHLHGILEADDPGYMHRAVLAQDLSAVTAACFVTHKQLYQQLGGLDETNLTVAFNDVDYCLRVREAGQRVIYTPYAELYHHESVSRGKDDSPEKQARAKREAKYMRSRWGHIIERDPFYNPNLNYSQPNFKLGKIPRVSWPW
ncbi:hypothetical protein GCM10022421_20000 [Oceanisphaera sediminis]|uniref:Glycosyltransferase 2-like domain-containing protein n=1 Tax=Oceanisphaera sediminis TaxID=981381 RepID=A0ABP7E688_9GAMM